MISPLILIEIPTVGTKENVRIFKEIELLDFKLTYLGAQEEFESVLECLEY